MRSDSILILIAGAGGFLGAGMFGPSPLNKYRDEFVKRYPDVPFLCLDWDQPAGVTPYIPGRRVLGVGHSFGGQRLFHQCFAVMNQPAPLSIDTIVIDPVRYSNSDMLDPTDTIDSNSVAQIFNRSPLPVPPNVRSCLCFLRKGGQSIPSYPESSPIAHVNGTTYQNNIVDVPGAFDLQKHADICGTDQVMNAFWKGAEDVFGEAS